MNKDKSTGSAAFVAEVDIAIRDALSQCQRPLTLRDATRHTCLAGGKRARPHLVYLFGQSANAPVAALRDAALTAELIHNASLMHDDVIDRASMRRGRPSANANWGNTIAVLGGDMLLTLALSHLRQYKRELTDNAIELVADMTRASVLEVEARGRTDINLSTWREIALGKTGALMAWCGYAAGYLADDEEAAARFSTCGAHLGVAFQMADDLKDVTGSEAGKVLFADLKNGNPSYVLYDAFIHSPALRQTVAEAWQTLPLDETRNELLAQQVLQTGTRERTSAAIAEEINAATAALGDYRDRDGLRTLMIWVDSLMPAAVRKLIND